MKLVRNIVVMLIAINAAIYLGCLVAGTEFAFNLLFNVVTPVICAFASLEAERKRKERLQDKA